MKKLDPGRTLDSVKAFPKQLKQIWQETKKLKLSTNYQKAKNLVLAGMGGSALGGRIVKSLFENQLRIPFQLVTEYQLPKFVNSESLVIVASYSGNTEETLACLSEAQKRKAMIFGLTTGGKLAEKIKKGLPGMIFKPKFNFLGYPKTAIGYSLGALIGFLAKSGFIQLTDSQFEKALKEFEKVDLESAAKKIAANFQDKISVVVSSEHLNGAAWAFRNQINEIAHYYSLFFVIPAMNHHLVEAFSQPEGAKKGLCYLFFRSNQYFSRNQQRYQISQQLLNQQKIKNWEYALQSQNKLAQVLEIVQLGGLTAVYLSFLNQQDPGPEPWIIYFKKSLKKQLTAYEKKR